MCIGIFVEVAVITQDFIFLIVVAGDRYQVVFHRIVKKFGPWG